MLPRKPAVISASIHAESTSDRQKGRCRGGRPRDALLLNLADDCNLGGLRLKRRGGQVVGWVTDSARKLDFEGLARVGVGSGTDAQRAWKFSRGGPASRTPVKLLRSLAVVLLVAAVARATTVIPPTFDELVSESELIFRGRVTAVKSGWSDAGVKPRIATWVTFAVERTLRGQVPETITLEFVGGAVGERRLEVAGWPRFEAGDRGVFFVENRQARMCPMVRLRHGRYRILESGSGAVERVVRDDYSAVEETNGSSRPMMEQLGPARAASGVAAVGLAQFEARIVERSGLLPRPQKVAR